MFADVGQADEEDLPLFVPLNHHLDVHLNHDRRGINIDRRGRLGLRDHCKSIVELNGAKLHAPHGLRGEHSSDSD